MGGFWKDSILPKRHLAVSFRRFLFLQFYISAVCSGFLLEIFLVVCLILRGTLCTIDWCIQSNKGRYKKNIWNYYSSHTLFMMDSPTFPKEFWWNYRLHFSISPFGILIFSRILEEFGLTKFSQKSSWIHLEFSKNVDVCIYSSLNKMVLLYLFWSFLLLRQFYGSAYPLCFVCYPSSFFRWTCDITWN